MNSEKTVDVVIPVYHPGDGFIEVLRALNSGTYPVSKIVIMQTLKSSEKIMDFPEFPNVFVYPVLEKEFDHGATRDLAIQHCSADFVLCMTHDAIPADSHLVENFVKALEETGAATAYGRQLPRKGAGALESYTRQFNYPEESSVKSKADLDRLGIKTFFCSNVAAMYRREIYLSLGGFVKKTIFNEDMIFAHQVIMNGYKIAYAAEARVLHSHSYSGIEQFRRNFDLGISQADHPEVFSGVSSEKEGGSLVKKTVSWMFKTGRPYLIFPFGYECVMKYSGYLLGKKYRKLPASFVKKCSMNKNYWEEN